MSSKGGTGSEDDRARGSRPDDEQADKVIRLPRDWLGPRDELVPFGPSAGDPEASSDPPDQAQKASGAAGGASDEQTRSAEDFWGERSAAVQGPLDESDRDLGENGHAGGAAGSLADRVRSRMPVLAAAAALVVAIAVAGVLLLGQSSKHIGLRADVGAGLDRGVPSFLPSLPPSAASGRAHSGRRTAGRNQARRSTRASGAVPVNYVRSGASQDASGAGGAGSGPSRSGSTPPPPTPSSPQHHAGPRPSPKTSSPGGTQRHSRACTFGPNCALGPGHSPDG